MLPETAMMPCGIEELPKKEVRIVVEHLQEESNNNVVQEEKSSSKSENCNAANSDPDDTYRIDHIFYRISRICFILGINFDRNRSCKMRCVSAGIVGFCCCINVYFTGYLLWLVLNKPFEADHVASSISIGTWVLQATLCTLFVAYWQYTGQPGELIKLLHDANQGAGIHHHRKYRSVIVNCFYGVTAICVCYYMFLMTANFMEVTVRYWDEDVHKIFGDRRLCMIIQLTSLYCKLCWCSGLFMYGLLIHSTNFEFLYYNEQVRSIKCNNENQTDEELCDYLLKLIKIHNRLTECVKLLDQMFHIYAFVMIATIIPTTIFSLFVVFRRPSESFNWDVLFLWPMVIFCVLTFVGLVNSPSRLHNTIYNTKSALCANMDIWFPYRPNVYHSALAFVCHLDQTNLGVSIWGFAVVSKPLVLTTLSVMVTCLALFLQVGDCNAGRQADLIPQITIFDY